ncbi:unnamed protein product, partial [Cuscuta campestris]
IPLNRNNLPNVAISAIFNVLIAVRIITGNIFCEIAWKSKAW